MNESTISLDVPQTSIANAQPAILAFIDSPQRILLWGQEPISQQQAQQLVASFTIQQSAVAVTQHTAHQWHVHYDEVLDLTIPYTFGWSDTEQWPIRFGAVVRSEAFDEQFAYEGPLGACYTQEQTVLRLWAPTALAVSAVVFDEQGVAQRIAMTRVDRGVYQGVLFGDQEGTAYLYEVCHPHVTHLVVDPYAKATTINGERAVITDVRPTGVARVAPVTNRSVIYEVHVRDLTIHPDSGVQHKGHYLGLTETGTRTSSGQATALDYMRQLGVSHVQLLPIFDYSSQSVDERRPLERYNWGYDPLHYNTPEGSYSTDASNYRARIEELQQAIDALHQSGIGVIMDVVYNHVFHIEEHSFDKIVPGYFFRHDIWGVPTNGTGVGNDFASERAMARKYIVDSVTYWYETYQLDGFRFDLMGMLDVATMQAVRRALPESCFILGEGWHMGTLPSEQKASQDNAHQLSGIAFFNDDMRDAVKGSTYGIIGRGFISGEPFQEQRVLQNIAGAQGIKPYRNPLQVIQYVEAHDNYTVWDQLEKTNGFEEEHIRRKRHRLATTIALLAQGVPFIHAGQEFMRSKQGDENSYRSPDAINQLDWHRAAQHRYDIAFVSGLIRLRQQEPLFCLDEYAAVDRCLTSLVADNQMVAYQLSDDTTALYVIHNAQTIEQCVTLPMGAYEVLVDHHRVYVAQAPMLPVADGTVVVPALSTLVLKRVHQHSGGWRKEGPIWRFYENNENM